MKGASGTKRRALGGMWRIGQWDACWSRNCGGVGLDGGWARASHSTNWNGRKKIFFSIWLTLVHKIHYLQKLTSCTFFFSRACWPLRKLCNAFALLLHPTFETSVIFIFFSYKKLSLSSHFRPRSGGNKSVWRNKESRLIAEEWNEKQ